MSASLSIHVANSFLMFSPRLIAHNCGTSHWSRTQSFSLIGYQENILSRMTSWILSVFLTASFYAASDTRHFLILHWLSTLLICILTSYSWTCWSQSSRCTPQPGIFFRGGGNLLSPWLFYKDTCYGLVHAPMNLNKVSSYHTIPIFITFYALKRPTSSGFGGEEGGLGNSFWLQAWVHVGHFLGIQNFRKWHC